ncbi:hypothetical protein [Acinetobacter sp. YZS-X1-1]|uniref:hypothetical protein n=1 Tax=Acinetobacter sp. YZS-X1-1 TaxID=1501691 RepID=UPI00054CB133|nr:hypothetical protein [Acinetobacter sp. YZS-X1-1]
MILKYLVAGPTDSLAAVTGALKITGHTNELGQPHQCRVDLYSKSGKKLVATTISDSQGNYEFKGLAANIKFFLITHHPSSRFNAVIQDNVVPK